MHRKSHSIVRTAATTQRLTRRCRSLLLGFTSLTALSPLVAGCERSPELHLHCGGHVTTELPVVDLELSVLWNYEITGDIAYDWRQEWLYGWDDADRSIFGELGYTRPEAFNIRRYFTGTEPNGPHTRVLADKIHGKSYAGTFDWGYWDLLAWNDILTVDGVQSLVFDETTLDRVIAATNQTMRASRYNAPRFTRSFHQPEALFSAYETAVEINRDLKGFTYDATRKVWVKNLEMQLEPRTYIYLTQVVLRHNNGKIAAVDGTATLSGMARTVNLNTGVSGDDPISVNYQVRLKTDCTKNGEPVAIVGGRLMTFGMCGVNASRLGRDGKKVESYNDGIRHYMDVTMQFNNGKDSTFVFDVTRQVRRRYRGGVLTVELDMDTVPVPRRSGGSGFNAVVKDYEDGGTHEFEM